MKISDFVKAELDYLRTECNFTKDQSILFDLRAQDVPLEKCAEYMNVSVSTINRLNKTLNKKINKVIQDNK